jgi:hypothetical protein
MANRVELSNEEQTVLSAIAALENDGEAATADSIAQRAALEVDTVRSALSRLVGEADLLREHEPDANVLGPHYTIKDNVSPQ